MEIWGGIGRGIKGFFSGMLRGVSNACRGAKILTFLFRSRRMYRARSYISYARGRGVLGSRHGFCALVLMIFTKTDWLSGAYEVVWVPKWI